MTIQKLIPYVLPNPPRLWQDPTRWQQRNSLQKQYLSSKGSLWFPELFSFKMESITDTGSSGAFGCVVWSSTAAVPMSPDLLTSFIGTDGTGSAQFNSLGCDTWQRGKPGSRAACGSLKCDQNRNNTQNLSTALLVISGLESQILIRLGQSRIQAANWSLGKASGRWRILLQLIQRPCIRAKLFFPRQKAAT